MNDGRFTLYTTKSGLPNDVVYSILEEQDGSLWIGTEAGGLIRFADEKFVVYNGANGLFDDVVGTILEDGVGNFWLDGEKGIYRVNKKDLNDYAAGKTGRLSYTS